MAFLPWRLFVLSGRFAFPPIMPAKLPRRHYERKYAAFREREGMPVSNRDRKRKFAIPGTGPDGGRNPAVTGAVIGKMAGGCLGEFHLCLVSRVSRHGL